MMHSLKRRCNHKSVDFDILLNQTEDLVDPFTSSGFAKSYEFLAFSDLVNP